MDKSKKALREIEIARLEFIGLSIATLGDGIAALAAGLTLESLENEYRTPYQSQQSMQVETTQKQLDYFIHELTQVRNIIR
ncbi:translation initiation factor 2 [Paenibacillus prosopidis]|uniref:Translation initiation factor 2 n=1 Tax=Paenibacillus prosopidis TaxID=630520 RepID=A0A368W0E9_9BACL|nr:translation initiation factor 2 [Paenibacillus prosopidis]RCW45428.1 hypothetical protein DFP97_11016 [Paenibacillus prosopidis]